MKLSACRRPRRWGFCGLLLLGLLGCGTTTQRLATEQLLISDAVDNAVHQIDFSHLADQDVYLDTKYLSAVKGVGFANSAYIVSAIRQQLSTSGCRVHDEIDKADIIVEPRVGVLGTDGHEVTYGIPQTGQLTTAAAALSSSPVPVIPEIAFGRSDEQLGVAKITLFAYDRETKVAVWQSGVKKAESTSSSTWVMGAGPFQKGTIHEGFRFAGRRIKRPALDDQAQVLDELEPNPLVDPSDEAAEVETATARTADADSTVVEPLETSQLR